MGVRDGRNKSDIEAGYIGIVSDGDQSIAFSMEWNLEADSARKCQPSKSEANQGRSQEKAGL